MKDVTAENGWLFGLGVGDGINIPIYVIVGFMQRHQFNQQHRSEHNFSRPSVINAQRFIGIGKYPDAGINFNYAIGNFSQGYGEIDSCFKHFAKDIILQPFFTQEVFITSNYYREGNPGYNLHIFDVRHHQDFSSAQPVKVRFEFRPAVPAATKLIWCTLLLTNKLVPVSSNVKRRFDFI